MCFFAAVLVRGFANTRRVFRSRWCPIGHQPILWHVMQYYSQYGHRDFILCLGYKANVIKDYFLIIRRQPQADCIVSDFGKEG